MEIGVRRPVPIRRPSRTVPQDVKRHLLLHTFLVAGLGTILGTGLVTALQSKLPQFLDVLEPILFKSGARPLVQSRTD